MLQLELDDLLVAQRNRMLLLRIMCGCADWAAEVDGSAEKPIDCPQCGEPYCGPVVSGKAGSSKESSCPCCTPPTPEQAVAFVACAAYECGRRGASTYLASEAQEQWLEYLPPEFRRAWGALVAELRVRAGLKTGSEQEVRIEIESARMHESLVSGALTLAINDAEHGLRVLEAFKRIIATGTPGEVREATMAVREAKLLKRLEFDDVCIALSNVRCPTVFRAVGEVLELDRSKSVMATQLEACAALLDAMPKNDVHGIEASLRTMAPWWRQHILVDNLAMEAMLRLCLVRNDLDAAVDVSERIRALVTANGATHAFTPCTTSLLCALYEELCTHFCHAALQEKESGLSPTDSHIRVCRKVLQLTKGLFVLHAYSSSTDDPYRSTAFRDSIENVAQVVLLDAMQSAEMLVLLEAITLSEECAREQDMLRAKSAYFDLHMRTFTPGTPLIDEALHSTVVVVPENDTRVSPDTTDCTAFGIKQHVPHGDNATIHDSIASVPEAFATAAPAVKARTSLTCSSTTGTNRRRSTRRRYNTVVLRDERLNKLTFPMLWGQLFMQPVSDNLEDIAQLVTECVHDRTAVGRRNVEVVEASVVRNPYLWNQYRTNKRKKYSGISSPFFSHATSEACSERLKNALVPVLLGSLPDMMTPSCGSDEIVAFFATEKDAADSIAKDGFSTQCMLGNLHFSPMACRALQRAVPDDDGIYTLILARVRPRHNLLIFLTAEEENSYDPLSCCIRKNDSVHEKNVTHDDTHYADEDDDECGAMANGECGAMANDECGASRLTVSSSGHSHNNDTTEYDEKPWHQELLMDPSNAECYPQFVIRVQVLVEETRAALSA
eukprot:GEMP01012951.1.p1 GENE.GEMP01012951.1~~GEMP01012951.1.p1  ORF type:complete len:850 (+),score=226.03 GEMP01012951.1:34-2550(+)